MVILGMLIAVYCLYGKGGVLIAINFFYNGGLVREYVELLYIYRSFDLFVCECT